MFAPSELRDVHGASRSSASRRCFSDLLMGTPTRVNPCNHWRLCLLVNDLHGIAPDQIIRTHQLLKEPHKKGVTHNWSPIDSYMSVKHAGAQEHPCTPECSLALGVLGATCYPGFHGLTNYSEYQEEFRVPGRSRYRRTSVAAYTLHYLRPQAQEWK